MKERWQVESENGIALENEGSTEGHAGLPAMLVPVFRCIIVATATSWKSGRWAELGPSS